MSSARDSRSAVLLPDGRVLIVGGWVGPRHYTASTEVFDPIAAAISAGPELPAAVHALAAVTLEDGRVLVTGGEIQPGVGTDPAMIFDQTTNSWIESGPMRTARFKHTTVLLGDGSVLVIGGTTDDRDILASTELFHPDTQSFSVGPDLAEPRYKVSGGVVVLDDGRVAIGAGGRTVEVLDLHAAPSNGYSRRSNRRASTTRDERSRP